MVVMGDNMQLEIPRVRNDLVMPPELDERLELETVKAMVDVELDVWLPDEGIIDSMIELLQSYKRRMWGDK